MAVRDDFAAGEVLAAADLNDTFASKQADVMTTKGDLTAYGTAVARLGVGSNGQVLTADSGETLGVKWASPSLGLVKVAGSLFTSVSSVTVAGCFTSLYDTYLIQYINTGNSASNTTVNLRMRSGGVDDTSASYFYAGTGQGWSASTKAYNNSGQTSAIVGYIHTGTNRSIINLYIRYPNVALNTTAIVDGYSETSTEDFRNSGMLMVATNTQYTDFTLFPGSGTFTGIVRVYGLEN